MFSILFSPLQLKAYKDKCLRLREAERKSLRVKIDFLRSESATWFGEIMRLDNNFYLRNHSNNHDSLSINVNLIERISTINGLLHIEYLGSNEKRTS